LDVRIVIGGRAHGANCEVLTIDTVAERAEGA